MLEWTAEPACAVRRAVSRSSHSPKLVLVKESDERVASGSAMIPSGFLASPLAVSPIVLRFSLITQES